MHPPITCDSIWDLLSAYADGEVTAEEYATVHTHIANCTDCGRAVLFLRKTAAALGSFPEVAPPPGLRQAILEATSHRRPTGVVASWVRFRGALAAGGVLSAAAACAAVWVVLHAASSASIPSTVAKTTMVAVTPQLPFNKGTVALQQTSVRRGGHGQVGEKQRAPVVYANAAPTTTPYAPAPAVSRQAHGPFELVSSSGLVPRGLARSHGLVRPPGHPLARVAAKQPPAPAGSQTADDATTPMIDPHMVVMPPGMSPDNPMVVMPPVSPVTAPAAPVSGTLHIQLAASAEPINISDVASLADLRNTLHNQNMDTMNRSHLLRINDRGEAKVDIYHTHF